MSSQDKQEPTPDHVAKLANVSVQLDKFALIGVFGAETSRAALIRDQKGKISRVTVGDRIANRTVSAIGEDKVILSSGGQTRALALPKS